jgi:ATP-dependent DNA helicase DinG
MPKPPHNVEGILGPDGVLVRTLHGFEFRPSQLQMARLAQEAINRDMPSLIEAGTGTGKTFGYLVPVLLSGKKAVISTGTKNLQEQIIFKDIPLLRKGTGLVIDAVMMKGRENYLCLHRYHQFSAQTSFLKTSQASRIRRIETWLRTTQYADRGEIPWLSDNDMLWASLSASSDQCLGSQCPCFDDCFLTRLRSRAARARIIVVNHYLFFADLKVKMGGFGEIIPRFQTAVFDEAHTIEDIATAYFGESLSTRQITDLTADLRKAVVDLDASARGRVERRLDAVLVGAEHLRREFDALGEKGRVAPELLLKLRQGTGRDMARGLRDVCGEAEIKDASKVRPLLERVREMSRLMEALLEERNGDWLNWYEKRKNSLVLHASPLDIAASMNHLLYGAIPTTLFTSATLTANRTFDYIRGRLGLPETTLQEVCPSHFDFPRQTLLYIPKTISPPTSPHFGQEAGDEIAKILERTRGRALVLFTSYHNLNIAYEILKGKIPYEVHKQGDAPRSVLLERFREDIHSVLLATGAFWQGVDVPGESLSCLIIDKLPFDSPGDPVVAARIDAIRRRGGNPFMEYQVPAAIIMLKQGLGRLIRKSSDRGILAILDVRILTSRYGGLFLQSLPRIPRTHDLTDIDRFFAETGPAAPAQPSIATKNAWRPCPPEPAARRSDWSDSTDG